MMFKTLVRSLRALGKIRMRIVACWNVLFAYHHYVILNIPENEMENFFTQKPFDVNSFHVGLQEYNVWVLVKNLAEVKDDAYMYLQKAAFEAEASLRVKS
jgi:hypothetical protein